MNQASEASEGSLTEEHLDLIAGAKRDALKDPAHRLHKYAQALDVALKARADAEQKRDKAAQHFADVLRLANLVNSGVAAANRELNAAINEDADKLISAGLRSFESLLACGPADLRAIESRYRSLTEISQRLVYHTIPRADRERRLAEIQAHRADSEQYSALGEFVEKLSAEACGAVFAIEGLDAAVEIKSGLSALCLAKAKNAADEMASKETSCQSWIKSREEQGLRF